MHHSWGRNIDFRRLYSAPQKPNNHDIKASRCDTNFGELNSATTTVDKSLIVIMNLYYISIFFPTHATVNSICNHTISCTSSTSCLSVTNFHSGISSLIFSRERRAHNPHHFLSHFPPDFLHPLHFSALAMKILSIFRKTAGLSRISMFCLPLKG